MAAHTSAGGHRGQLLSGDVLCGCFHCCQMFAPTSIIEWVDPDDAGVGQTALCPPCGIDSVIGSCSGYPITADFLNRMQLHWFGID
ncbi:MAG: hypothetical protein FGM52_07150 [Mycobacterium sp.]|nr:hypothetical protein [Mycobacterium sp.]